MESQTNDGKKQTQNQTKNKNKERKRLMSLFRAPKVEYELYRKTTEEESNDIKNTIIEIINQNSSLKLHPKKKKTSEKTIEDKETNESQLKLTNDLILGLNSIIRSIEKKSIIGVILTNPLALPLENNVIELCTNNQIPCLSVLSFDEMKSCLNISSLSAIAFKPNIISKDSIFNKLYEKFRTFLDINCSANESNEQKDIKHETKEKAKEENCNKIGIQPNKSESTFNKSHPLFESLYSKKNEDNYRLLVNKYMKGLKGSNQHKDDFSAQKSLIKFSSKSELHFPQTKDKQIPKIEIILEEQQIHSNDDSFAQSLIESMEESDYKPLKDLKRKFNQSNEKHGLNFKTPRVVRLEPSTQKIQKRKHKKQMKKLNKCHKKS